MSDDKEESTGIDFKYHLITLLIIIGMIGIVFLMNFNNPGYTDEKLGEVSTSLIVGVVIFRWLTKK